MLDHAFGALGLHRIALFVFEFNERAIATYRRCGFVVEGRARESIFRDGRWWDELAMSVLERDWRRQREDRAADDAEREALRAEVRSADAAAAAPEPEPIGVRAAPGRDLIRRTEIGTERRRSWWLDLLTPSETRAEDYVRAHAVRVADVMSRHVITASETAPLSEIATLLEKHGIKRVPIVRDGRIVGLVSRANLVRALAAAPVQEPLGVDDRTIRERIIDRIRALPACGIGFELVLIAPLLRALRRRR